MLTAITIQSIFIVIGIGILGLFPVLLINRRTNKIDKSMYNKNFNATKDLEAYKTNEPEDIPDIEKKLRQFKVTD